MLPHLVQFAVVREDPEVERLVLSRNNRPARALLVASGGCTALTLQSYWPELELTLVDPNPHQLELVRTKVEALGYGAGHDTLHRFNVGDADARGLSECGNFEALFRGLRGFLHEFVANDREIVDWFGDARSTESIEQAIANPYWQVAFEMYFGDALLNAMFTEAATQHAPPGSYPSYFRERLERGLLAGDARTNRFLHHVFLGRYVPNQESLPRFLVVPAESHRFEFVESRLEDVPTFSGFDLVDLSNVMDWMAVEPARALAARIGSELQPGASVLWRQLNNTTERRDWFGDDVRFDPAFDARLTETDRSLFYESIHLGTKS